MNYREVQGWLHVAGTGGGITILTTHPAFHYDDHTLAAVLLRTSPSCGDNRLFWENAGEQVFTFTLLLNGNDLAHGACPAVGSPSPAATGMPHGEGERRRFARGKESAPSRWSVRSAIQSVWRLRARYNRRACLGDRRRAADGHLYRVAERRQRGRSRPARCGKRGDSYRQTGRLAAQLATVGHSHRATDSLTERRFLATKEVRRSSLFQAFLGFGPLVQFNSHSSKEQREDFMHSQLSRRSFLQLTAGTMAGAFLAACAPAAAPAPASEGAAAPAAEQVTLNVWWFDDRSTWR